MNKMRVQENFAIAKRATTGGSHEFFIVPKRYFKSRTEVYWPNNEQLVGKNHITNENVKPDCTWDLFQCLIQLWLETERDAKKLLNVFLKTSTSDEEADVEKFIKLRGIKAAKPSPIRTVKRILEDSLENLELLGQLPSSSKDSIHPKAKMIKTSSKFSPSIIQVPNDLPAKILASPLSSKNATPQTPKQLATLPQKLLNDILKGITEIKSRIDIVENKVDACTAAVAAIQAEQKRMTDVLSTQPVHLNHAEIEIDDDLIKDIEDSFPIENRQTLERFNTVLSDPKNVMIFVKHMSDLHVKDSAISDGKKLVRNFIDHFFTRKFMLEINRTGIRRSAGPPKIQLERFENILQTFHKCIRVGVPNFGYEGTKRTLWRLCDTAFQRYKEATADKYGEYQQRDGECLDEIEDYVHFDADEEAIETTFYELTHTDNESE